MAALPYDLGGVDPGPNDRAGVAQRTSGRRRGSRISSRVPRGRLSFCRHSEACGGSSSVCLVTQSCCISGTCPRLQCVRVRLPARVGGSSMRCHGSSTRPGCGAGPRRHNRGGLPSRAGRPAGAVGRGHRGHQVGPPRLRRRRGRERRPTGGGARGSWASNSFSRTRCHARKLAWLCTCVAWCTWSCLNQIDTGSGGPAVP